MQRSASVWKQIFPANGRYTAPCGWEWYLPQASGCVLVPVAVADVPCPAVPPAVRAQDVLAGEARPWPFAKLE